jgi:hypothetical protein
MKTIIPIEIIPLGDDVSLHLFVSAIVNGNLCNLLIDTGASHTIFDATQVESVPNEMVNVQSAGIGTTQLDISQGYIETFQIGDMKIDDWDVVLLDLTHVNNLYESVANKHVIGLIGSDFLLKYSAVIDYKKRELLLRYRKKDFK